MCADHQPSGPAALLRVAGVPASLLAAAGNPELFARIREHAAGQRDYRVFGTALAEHLGRHLVPHPELTRPLRTAVLEVRRGLFRGDPVSSAQCRRLAVACSVLETSDGVVQDLLRAGAWSDRLSADSHDLSEAILAEDERLAALPWQLGEASHVIAETAPDLLDDIRQRLARGERWTTKRMRQRSEYLMRLLGRAAFKTTPRGWLGQVALVGLGPGPATRLLTGAHVGKFAAHEVTNVQADRRALAAANDLADAWLSMTGLHWVTADRLCCWVTDQEKPGSLRFVRVRRTSAVDAVRQVLGAGVMRTGDVITVLAPGSEQRRKVVHDFLRHLVRLGIVQISARPASRLRGWSAAPPTARDRTGFVDVYRGATGHVPMATANTVATLLGPARRLQALLRQGQAPQRHPVLDLVGPRPRPVTGILAEFLDSHEPRQPVPRPHTWPTPEPGTPYHRLCDWLAERAGQAEITITGEVLDRVGAPAADAPLWPVDCLLRPLAGEGPLAVLEAVSPAGVLDARFTEALRQLHGHVPQVDGHRAFLDATAVRCGVEFVEILVPPQNDRGANAVRRPRYTATWTGDADHSTYLTEAHGPARYLPLDRITVRHADGRVIAEDPAGRQLWPVYHATRVPPAPWDVVLALLTAASPVDALAGSFVPGDHTTVFPGHDRVPRLLLGDGLVLGGRSVQVGQEQVGAPGTPLDQRVRALAELRVRTGAPRWNFVRVAGGRRPRPVDLDSVTALRTFDRLLAEPGVQSLVLEEMLPAPHQFPVRDASGDGIAAQLLLRLPCRSNPGQLADRIARASRSSGRAVAEAVVAAS